MNFYEKIRNNYFIFSYFPLWIPLERAERSEANIVKQSFAS